MADVNILNMRELLHTAGLCSIAYLFQAVGLLLAIEVEPEPLSERHHHEVKGQQQWLKVRDLLQQCWTDLLLYLHSCTAQVKVN